MKPAKNIEKHIKNIYVESLPAATSAELDKRVLGNVTEALEESKKKNSAAIEANIWRIIIKSRITKLAAAAVIIIAVFIGIKHFGGSIDGASVAFAEIKKAVNKMPLLHKVLQTERDGKKFYTENWYSFESKTIVSKFAVDGKCSKISSLDYHTKENIVYNPDSDIVRISYRVDVDFGGGPSSPWSIVGDYIDGYVQEDADVSHEKGLYEGNDVDIYYFSIDRNFRNEYVEAEFIVNRNSHLPILYKRKFWTPEGQVWFDQVISFDFPENGPKDIYDLGVSRTTKVVHDLESKKRLDRKMELLDDKAVYEERFKEIYRLKEGEVLKYIPPSLTESRIKIDEINRAVWQLEREGSQIMTPMATGEKEQKSKDNYTMFSWNGKIARGTIRPTFTDGVSLKAAFESIIVLSEFQYDSIPYTLRSVRIPGDWVIRNSTPKEQLLDALERILQNFTKRPIRFKKRQIERDVIVARGKFRFKPLIGTYDDNWIHVFSDKLDPDEGGGGGTYSLDRFLTQRLAEIQLKQQVVNLTKSSDNVIIKCGCHESAYLGEIVPGPERDAKLDLLLENLSRQTSLVFTKERRKVDIWYVVEDGQD